MKVIKVKLEFSWEFDSKMWESNLSHQKAIKDLSNKAKFDPLDVFYILNDICKADIKIVSIK